MDLQDAFDALTERLAGVQTASDDQGHSQQLNQTMRELVGLNNERPTFDLVNTITSFDGDKPDSILRFFENIEDVAELSNWGSKECLRVAKLKISGAALNFIKSEDQSRITTYDEFKGVLIERFSDKAPQHCYSQQLAVIKQRRGETIEAFCDRVKALNEKTIRVTANAEVNAALREEADRRALDAFVRGLLGVVGEQTRLKFPTSMKEAVTTAVAIEHLLPASDPGRTMPERKVFHSEITCFRCHQRGHISKDCRVKSSRPSSADQNLVCWRCDKPGHVQRDCRAQRSSPSTSNSGNGERAGTSTAASPKN